MKAWLTVLALAAAVPGPAPAMPVFDTQAVAPATAQRLPQLQDIAASLAAAQGPAAGADAVALALALEASAATLAAIAPAVPAGAMALSPWSLEPPVPGPGDAAAPLAREALRALAFPSAAALPRDVQSLQALARGVPGAVQLARELREVPREERLDYLLNLLQDPAVEGELLDAAAALHGEDDGPDLASWAEYGLGLAAALLGVLACIAPAARRRGPGRAFNGPQPPLPPAFAPAQRPRDGAAPRVHRKAHLSPLNRPLPTTQATAHAPLAD